jgi:hypothetical protein
MKDAAMSKVPRYYNCSKGNENQAVQAREG